MKLIRPTDITAGLVTANSAVNADANYLAGTTYAADAKVTYSGRIYKSLQAANTGKTPGLTGSVAWWSDQGPSNQYAAFDDQVNTKTTATSPWTFTLSGVNIDSIALLNLDATHVEITVKIGGDVIYSKSQSLIDASLIANWGEYFFSPPEFKRDIVFEGVPALPGLVVEVTISRSGGGEVSCGKFGIGSSLDLGPELLGLNRDGVDYTNVTFDQFGVATIGPQRYVRKFSTQVIVEHRRVDMLLRRLDQLASTPVVVIGANGIFSSMIVYGLMTYKIDMSLARYAYISFDIKGLI